MLLSSTDVLIVGAGPTGLALSTLLAQERIAHVLVDRLDEGQHTSRAAVIHAHTLDVLEQIGVSAELVARGVAITDFAVLDRDPTLLRTRFDDLPTRHPYLLMLPQDVTEETLTARLRNAGGTIHRGATVESVAQDADGAIATVISAGRRGTIAARYVVGADGMHSVVRGAAGIGFVGAAYEDSFILADVAMDWGHGRDAVRLYFSPAGLVAVAPLPDGRFRIVATAEDAPEHPGLADVQALLDARGPTRGAARIRSGAADRSRHDEEPATARAAQPRDVAGGACARPAPQDRNGPFGAEQTEACGR